MSFFSNIFGRRKLKSPVDLSVLEVDIHSHILPGIDDGAEDISVSIEMVRQLTGLGYRKLITTPHIMSDTYKNTPQTILKAKDALIVELKKSGLNTEIVVGAEYMLDEGLMEHIERHEVLTLSKNYVLLELPYFTEPPNIYEVIFQLSLKGYTVVLAHPERYVYWYDDFSKYSKLKDRDVLFQINLLTFANAYAYHTRKIAENLVNNGMVNFLGTDIHSDKQFQLLEKALYDPVVARLVESGNLMNHIL